MPNVAVIGYGAMAGYVAAHLRQSGWTLSHCIARAGREDVAQMRLGASVNVINDVDGLEALPDLVVDCAGHAGLIEHGAGVLRKGLPLVTVSLGALADDAIHAQMTAAAQHGGTQLFLASGAIGALDALSAAKVGGLSEVTYTGIKPPAGWRGSPAEDTLDLENLDTTTTHFDGTARDAALRYPKNANVAAAVALAGIGLDATQARLVADPNATGNTHIITAKGAFGSFEFTIKGNSLPESSRTSALAAMSVVDQILRKSAPFTL
jgi:aspartate dehydrogenase